MAEGIPMDDLIYNLQIIDSEFSTYPKNTEDAVTKMEYYIGIDLISDMFLIEGLIPSGQGILFAMDINANSHRTTITLTRNIDICRETAIFVEFVQKMKDYLFQIYKSSKSR